jgi:hypothetical protein
MKKTTPFYSLFLLAGFFSILNIGMLQAQTTIWGTGSTDPAIDSIGRFASTDGTLAGAGWTAISNFDLNGTPGNALWVHSTAGVSTGLYWGTRTPINSPSMSDGVALFDSDFLDNGGIGFGQGTAPGFPGGHSGQLVSPVIDLTGYTDSTLTVKFYNYYREFDITGISVGISTDGGTTWADYDVRETTGISGANQESEKGFVRVVLRDALDGVANLSNCQIRFNFEGAYYFWMVDDVSIETTPLYDLAFAFPVVGGTSNVDRMTIGRTSNNYSQPWSQADSSEYFYAARLTNFGSNDFLDASGSSYLKYIVEKDNGGSWTMVHMDSTIIDTVFAGVLPGGVGQAGDYFGDLGWQPTSAADVGLYRLTYILENNLTNDDYSDNDTASHTFEITENYFSKVRRNNAGAPFAATASFPAAGTGNIVQEFEYGSMFYFPQGTYFDYLDSVNYRVLANTDFAPGFTEGIIVIKVYKWTDGAGGGSPNGRLDADPNSGELTLLGIGQDTLTAVADQYIASSVPVIDINNGAFGLPLEDDEIYLVSVEQTGGLEDANGDYNGFWVAVDRLNYGWNTVLADAVPSPVRIAEGPIGSAATSNDWNWVGFGPDRAPSIGLVMYKDTSTTTNIEVVEQGLDGLKVFPNPTSDVLNISLDLEEGTNFVQYFLTDIHGRILNIQTFKNDWDQNQCLDVAKYPAGTYFLTVKTNKGSETKRFVKR